MDFSFFLGIALVLFVIGNMFNSNKSNGIDLDKIKILADKVDDDLNNEFVKIDKKIEELENKIKTLENIILNNKGDTND